jgi:hypothetical protein
MKMVLLVSSAEPQPGFKFARGKTRLEHREFDSEGIVEIAVRLENGFDFDRYMVENVAANVKKESEIMDTFEQAVLHYISEHPSRFVKSQFSIPFDKETKSGGSQPDFLVLDFDVRKIYIVEVSSASSLTTLYSRLEERETRWFSPLHKYLPSLNGGFESWSLHVTLFIRGENVSAAKQKFADSKDVSVISLDEVIFDWRWKKWEKEKGQNQLEHSR